jgi:recombination protein RecA
MDKREDFNKVLKKIEDSYGVRIRKLGDFKENIESIPSGSLILDDILGVGGYPRGRLVEVYGEFSSGKCISANSYIFTEDGLLTLKELKSDLKKNEYSKFEVSLLTQSVNAKSSYIYNDGFKRSLRVFTESGFELIGSLETTKIRVLREGGLEWVPLNKLKVGDKILLRGEGSIFGKTKIKKSLKQIYKWGKTYDKDKEFPLEIRKAPKEQVIAFLGGLIEANGNLYESCLFFSLPKEWIKIIQLFLLNLGIISYRKKLIKNKFDTLFIIKSNLLKFKIIFNKWCKLCKDIVVSNNVEMIPYGHRVMEYFKKSINKDYKIDLYKEHASRAEVIDFLKLFEEYRFNPLYMLLRGMELGNYILDEVKELEVIEKEEVWDLTVPFFHNFVANGIVVHNTLLGLLGIASVQKLGGKALFIDAEYTLDLKWAKTLGVKVEDLYVVQENCLEKVMNILEKFLEESLFDLIVVDSVTALVPQKELEGEMEDQNIALQARLMSQALRKLVGKLSKSKAVVIFINQLRDNVGVMFGDPSTTPGGRALKFYSSVRIKVGKEPGSDIKKDNVKIGHRIKFKVEKNKVATPFKEGSTLLYYSKGIDETRELLEYGLSKEVIKLSGNTYSYKDHKWVGFDKMLDFFKNSSELIDELKKDLGLTHVKIS